MELSIVVVKTTYMYIKAVNKSAARTYGESETVGVVTLLPGYGTLEGLRGQGSDAHTLS